MAAYGSDHLFRVRSIHGAIVALESAKFPGHFVSVGKHGVLVLERQELKSHCVQFTVYVSVSIYTLLLLILSCATHMYVVCVVCVAATACSSLSMSV